MFTVDIIVCTTPLFAYGLCYYLYAAESLALLCVFGALGCSLSAFGLWIRSRFLVSLYLQERAVRNDARLRRINEDGRKPPDEAASGVTDSWAKSDVRELPHHGPRTVARLSPVLPAFLSLLYVVLTFGNLLIAAVCIVREKPVYGS